MAEQLICKKCRSRYEEEYGDEDEDLSIGTGLCYYCFEEGVEEAEERRLRRIQEQNEY